MQVFQQNEDLLAKLGPLSSFVRLGLTFSVCQSCQLSAEDAAWAFNLCKTNMEVSMCTPAGHRAACAHANLLHLECSIPVVLGMIPQQKVCLQAVGLSP